MDRAAAPRLRGLPRQGRSGCPGDRGFGRPQRLRFDWDTTISRDAFLEQVPTAGGHNRIAPEKLAELLAGLGAAIDAAGGTFTMRYATLALVSPLSRHEKRR